MSFRLRTRWTTGRPLFDLSTRIGQRTVLVEMLFRDAGAIRVLRLNGTNATNGINETNELQQDPHRPDDVLKMDADEPNARKMLWQRRKEPLGQHGGRLNVFRLISK